jgi:DNA-binding MarR family transcriptional regulator/GNAT superfamily N-acetyltransferase
MRVEPKDRIAAVRADSRRIVRELGFLDQTLAATPYPPSSVHALIEIGGAPGITAAELAEELLLDRSSVSRLLRKLVDAGEVRQDEVAGDRRHKSLALSSEGRQTLQAINDYATSQVRDALALLDEPEREAVRTGLHAYAQALARLRLGDLVPAAGSRQRIRIDTEVRPGDIGQVVALHGREYAKLAGFGVGFEALIAADLADFVRRGHPDSRIWIARDDEGTVVGSIAIDRSHSPRAAHLRWFLVTQESRGAGLGRQLLSDALAYCDGNGVEETTLWTFQGLDTARALYEKHDFTLVAEQPGGRWGSAVVEQQFHRMLGAGMRGVGSRGVRHADRR